MPELHLLRIVPELLRFYIFVRICLGYRHLLPGGPRNTHSIFLQCFCLLLLGSWLPLLSSARKPPFVVGDERHTQCDTFLYDNPKRGAKGYLAKYVNKNGEIDIFIPPYLKKICGCSGQLPLFNKGACLGIPGALSLTV
jgi:hypothetical protein